MEDTKNVVDVEFQDIDNEIYLTAPQIAQRIKDTDIRVRHWADVFGDLIGIEKLNGRKRYKESDVYKFAFIKDLLDNKNFRHDQARLYLSKNGFKYAEYDSGLVDIKDPLGFQALAAALSVEVDNKLNNFAENLLSNISNQLNEYLVKQMQINIEMKAEVEAAVDDIVSEKLEQQKQEIKIILDYQEQKAKTRDIELIDKLKSSMQDHQHQYEQQFQLQQQSQTKKSFFRRLFNTK